VVTTGAIRRAKLQSNRHHQHLFTDQMPFLSPNQQYQSIKGKAGTYVNTHLMNTYH